MASFVYKPECPHANSNGFVDKGTYYQWLYHKTPDNRMTIGNRVVEFRFIADEMAPTRHMCNGQYYTSKKKFRNETKARGCVEIGNDTAPLLKRREPKRLDKRQRREDIKKSIYELKNGRDIKTEMKELKYD